MRKPSEIIHNILNDLAELEALLREETVTLPKADMVVPSRIPQRQSYLTEIHLHWRRRSRSIFVHARRPFSVDEAADWNPRGSRQFIYMALMELVQLGEMERWPEDLVGHRGAPRYLYNLINAEKAKAA